MKNIILFVILIFIFVSCSKTTPEAPFAHNSTLVGFVKFENALSDTVEAEVSLFQQSQGIKIASTQTDKNGKFVFEDISADTYQIQIKTTGFEDKYLSTAVGYYRRIGRNGNYPFQKSLGSTQTPVGFLQILAHFL